MITIDRSRIKMLMEREKKRYVGERPKSQALFNRAKASLLDGVPMDWMKIGPCPFPVFMKEAKGVYLTDVDGHRYLDIFMGDHGATFGHSPRAMADVVADIVHRGVTSMLPTEDSIWVGEELTRRFGLPYWQIYMTATDANRFALKIAREATKRSLVLVFNGCYHGTVDEALVWFDDGVIRSDPECVGPLPNPELLARVIEFNDLDALERVLSARDIACVLCEPYMTNSGFIPPEPGYHAALREMTRRFGTLLIYDETHTIACGPGGLTRVWDLEPDMLTLGKPIAAGVPAAVMGVSQEVADKFLNRPLAPPGTYGSSGIGGTLSANAMAVAAMRATLEHIMTKSTYDQMFAAAQRLADDMESTIKAADLPWHVTRLGSKIEVIFHPTLPRNATESRATFDYELGHLSALFLINRRILVSPWAIMIHGMVGPQTTDKDIDFYNTVFREYVNDLVG